MNIRFKKMSVSLRLERRVLSPIGVGLIGFNSVSYLVNGSINFC